MRFIFAKIYTTKQQYKNLKNKSLNDNLIIRKESIVVDVDLNYELRT